jgi:hypothetical protein
VNNGNGSNDVVYDDLSIKVIKDSRDTATSVDGIVSELKALPSIQNAEFTIVDFEDA